MPKKANKPSLTPAEVMMLKAGLQAEYEEKEEFDSIDPNEFVVAQVRFVPSSKRFEAVLVPKISFLGIMKGGMGPSRRWDMRESMLEMAMVDDARIIIWPLTPNTNLELLDVVRLGIKKVDSLVKSIGPEITA